MKLRTDDFQHRLADARAQWSKDGHTVLRYGDPINEYWAVRDGGLGLIDRSERETIVIHGDDFTSLGSEEDLNWFRSEIQKKFEVKLRGRIGPGSSDQKSIRLLNRVFEWTPEGI